MRIMCENPDRGFNLLAFRISQARFDVLHFRKLLEMLLKYMICFLNLLARSMSVCRLVLFLSHSFHQKGAKSKRHVFTVGDDVIDVT